MQTEDLSSYEGALDYVVDHTPAEVASRIAVDRRALLAAQARQAQADSAGLVDGLLWGASG